jgi:hypothetical protein
MEQSAMNKHKCAICNDHLSADECAALIARSMEKFTVPFSQAVDGMHYVVIDFADQSDRGVDALATEFGGKCDWTVPHDRTADADGVMSLAGGWEGVYGIPESAVLGFVHALALRGMTGRYKQLEEWYDHPASPEDSPRAQANCAWDSLRGIDCHTDRFLAGKTALARLESKWSALAPHWPALTDDERSEATAAYWAHKAELEADLARLSALEHKRFGSFAATDRVRDREVEAPVGDLSPERAELATREPVQ